MSRRTLLQRTRKLLLDSTDSTNMSCGVAGGVLSRGVPETCAESAPTFPRMSLWATLYQYVTPLAGPVNGRGLPGTVLGSGFPVVSQRS